MIHISQSQTLLYLLFTPFQINGALNLPFARPVFPVNGVSVARWPRTVSVLTPAGPLCVLPTCSPSTGPWGTLTVTRLHNERACGDSTQHNKRGLRASPHWQVHWSGGELLLPHRHFHESAQHSEHEGCSRRTGKVHSTVDSTE